MAGENSRTRTRIDSKIMRLPLEIREEIDDRLKDTSITFTDISDWLKEQGYDISRSAVGRYRLHLSKAADRIIESLEKMRVIVQAVESNPDVDYTKASRILAMDGLLQRVASAEEEFMDLPLDKAIALIGSLTNTEIQDRRAKHSSKNKMELAFDSMEDELSKAIKSDPELAKEFQAVMQKARQQIFSDK